MRRALAFLTPVGGAVPPGPGAVAWFPVVGVLVGLAVGTVWWGASQWWPPAVAAALAVTADLAFTGMLHADGLVDTADGLLPPMSRERRLEVMADPRAGAFGVVAAVAVLLLRWSALASTQAAPALVAGLWCGSRTLMAAGLRALPYARGGGLGEVFGAGPNGGRALGPSVAAGALATTALAIWAVGPAQGLVATAALAAAGGGVLALARRRLGGFTGDVLGAAGLVGETAALVVAAARW